MARDDGFHTGFALPPAAAAAAHRRSEKQSLPSGGGGGGQPQYRSPGRPAPRGNAINRRIQANSSGRYSRPAAPPPQTAGAVPSIGGGDINSYLAGDSGYQQQLAGFAKTLQDFLGDLTRRKGTLQTEFGVSDKALRGQRTKDLDTLEDDFGARGLIHSGLYAGAVGDYEKEFNERVAELARKQQEALGALTQEEGQFKSAQQLREQAAREEAIRRRAEQYGQ